jgi:2-polyprenyl-6-hydroxyphenyl methylase/3-demethylubiquinone-9 3-methyltransferase
MNLQSIYELSAQEWWNDRDGPMAPLHWMTPVRFDYFARAAGSLAGRDVLDLGCGGGLLAERFATAGARVVGIDPLTACCRAAATHARAAALPIRYVQMAGERLALADNSFDVAVAADVLEHVNDLPRVIAEVGRVLRPGGTFVFDTINRTWLSRLVLVWLGERVLKVVPCGTHDPARFIRPAELRARLTAAGMRLRQTRGLGPVGWWGGRVRFGRLPCTWLSYLGWASKDEG